MLNRPIAVARTLDVRRAMAGELRAFLRDTPPSPIHWTTFDAAATLAGAATPNQPPHPALDAFLRCLTAGNGRVAERRALVRESVLTATFAWRLAPLLGADPQTCAIAGLLHRVGDLLALAAIGSLEAGGQAHLGAAAKATLCAEHGPDALDRALRAWHVPARAAATAAEWQRLREFPGAAAESTAVHLGRLFAIERLTPQLCAPGVVDAAAREAGLDAGALSKLRGDATIQ